MGNSSSSQTKPKTWADGPFELVPTPYETTPESEHDDFTKAAWEMHTVHNGIIRGLNSIYQQARVLPPSDIPDFLEYARAWSSFLHLHHNGEETHFFPSITAAIGSASHMEPNIAEHASFDAALTAFDEYINTCLPNPDVTFSGENLCSLIDAFAPTMVVHLGAEIGTLLSLRQFGDRLPLLQLSHDEGKIQMQRAPKTDVVSVFVTNLDYSSSRGEGEMQRMATFPPAPWFVRVILARYVWTWPKRRLWRFSSCGKDGRPKKLWGFRYEE